MTPKNFTLDAGKHLVVCSYTEQKESTGEKDETTIRTDEKPRPKLYTDFATLALRAQELFGVGMDMVVRKLSFSHTDKGQFVTVTLESVAAERKIIVKPAKVKRERVTLPGDIEPIPDSPLNLFLDAVDVAEQRIQEYLGGDREQPDLKPEKEDPEEKSPGLFGRLGKKRKAGK